MQGHTLLYFNNVSWEIQGKLNIFLNGENMPKLTLEVNYLAPSLPGLYNKIKPQLQLFLLNLRYAIKQNNTNVLLLKNKFVVVYYQLNSGKMMKCKADYMVIYRNNNMIIKLYYSKQQTGLPLAFEVNGVVVGKGSLMLGKNINCGSSLVSNSLRKSLLYTTISITVLALMSFILKPRLKMRYPMHSY